MKLRAHIIKLLSALSLLLPGGTSPIVAQPLPNVAGTWNNILFSVPARLTLWKNTDGTVFGINETNAFETRTAQFTVQADGSFSGPQSGTFSVVGPGLIRASVPGASVTFMINSGSNFMFSMKSDGWANDIELLLKAPTNVSSNDLAGVWKSATFGSPAALTVNTNSNGIITGINGGNNFEANADVLTTYLDGSFVFSGSGFGGTFSVQANGLVHAIVPLPPPNPPLVIDFFINESKDIMAGVMNDGSSQELLFFCKQPADNTEIGQIKGVSNIGYFEIPAYISVITNKDGEVTDVPQRDDFWYDLSRLSVGHTGIFTDEGERSMGELSVTQPGTLNVTMGGQNVDTCWINASRDVFFSLHHGSIFEFVIGAKTPALANPREGMGMMLLQETNTLMVCWASETNRCLQASPDCANWTNLTSTLGQSSYTLSATNGPKSFYRVADDAP